MSQVDAAKVLGISRRTYQKYEALEDESDNKLKYYIFRLNELNVLDEEHGILKMQIIYSLNITLTFVICLALMLKIKQPLKAI